MKIIRVIYLYVIVFMIFLKEGLYVLIFLINFYKGKFDNIKILRN